MSSAVRLALCCALLLGSGMCAAQQMLCDKAATFAEQIPKLRVSDAEKQGLLARLQVGLRNLIQAHARLIGVADVKPELVVCLSPMANAFVMEPGKPIFVLTGFLMRYGHDAEFLAAMLAHELGHLDRNHAGYRRYAIEYFKAYGNAVRNHEFYRTGDLTRATRTAVQATLSQAFAFSREQEADADSIGVVLLTRAGYKPDAMMKTMSRLLLDSEHRTTRWFDTHPGWADRMNRVEPRVLDEETDQVARALASEGNHRELARRINEWLRQLPDSGNAWFHRAAFLERLGAEGHVEAYERALNAQRPSISRTSDELQEVWLSLCAALFRAGHKLESAHCSKFIKNPELRDKFRSATFGETLFMHGPEPAPTSILTARDRDGTRLITNDKSVLQARGIEHEQAAAPWRPIRFPPGDVTRPLPQR